MGSETAPAVRDAEHDDVDAICRFGETHVRTHYAPLIGADAAGQQVRTWWNADRISAAVAEGLVVVAAADGEIVGVGQLGRNGDDPVVYKLYVHPGHRNHGLGPQLIDAIIQRLPPTADRLYIEHFAANDRASSFYEREGFTVDRIEPSPMRDPALAVVWRVRDLAVAEG